MLNNLFLLPYAKGEATFTEIHKEASAGRGGNVSGQVAGELVWEPRGSSKEGFGETTGAMWEGPP